MQVYFAVLTSYFHDQKREEGVYKPFIHKETEDAMKLEVQPYIDKHNWSPNLQLHYMIVVDGKWRY